MKKTLIALTTCLFLFAGQTRAQSLIYYWNFNNLNTSYSAPVNPATLAIIPVDTFTGVTPAALHYRAIPGTPATYQSYYDTVTGDSINSQLFALSGKALGFHNPSDSMEAIFYVPSTGYNHITFKFGGETNNGPKYVQFAYSIDSGATWLTNGLKTINGLAPGSLALDSLTTFWSLNSLVFDSTVDNSSGFVIRMRFWDGATGTSGSMAIDNVTLEGIPYKSSVVNISQNNAVILYPNPASASININTPSASEKSITVYNTTGQAVYTTATATQMITVPLNSLPTGMYYVLIHENVTGENYSARFLKE